MKTLKGNEMMLDEEAIAAAILRAASMLGNGNASTPMGAIEAHAVKSYQGMEEVRHSIDGVAYSLDNIANAITYLADAIKEKE
jgi:spore maturation protein SpmA